MQALVEAEWAVRQLVTEGVWISVGVFGYFTSVSESCHFQLLFTFIAFTRDIPHCSHSPFYFTDNISEMCRVGRNRRVA